MVLFYKLTKIILSSTYLLPLLFRFYIEHLYPVFCIISWSCMSSADFIILYDLHFRISCFVVFFLVGCKWLCLAVVKCLNISSSFLHLLWCLEISPNTTIQPKKAIYLHIEAVYSSPHLYVPSENHEKCWELCRINFCVHSTLYVCVWWEVTGRHSIHR